MALITCKVAKGDIPLDFFWSLNEVPIINGQWSAKVSRVNARASTLSIDVLDATHRGNFSCVARNKAGFTEFRAELQVNG